MLDAITSFRHVVFDISDNSNELKQGASIGAFAGPGSSNFLLKKTHWHPMKWKFYFWGHQALFESLHTNYRGSKRLWGSPHQVWLLVFDFTFSCILKKFNWDFARQGITDMSIVSPASFIVTADWLDPLSITSLTSPLSLCTNRSSVIASFGL